MQTLAVMSRKGGTGKTTLSVNLAATAWAAGVRTVVADLDGQRSALAWAKARRLEGPAVLETTAGKLFPMWSAAANAGCELMILDTPAGGEAETLQALRLADLCILVCRPCFFDILALARNIELLRRFGRAGLIVINQAPSRRMGRESQAVLSAIDDLAGAGVPLARTGLRHRAVFPAAAARGLSAHELDPDCAGAREVEGVWLQAREILDALRGAAPASILAAARSLQTQQGLSA
jgi:chromosome partitioning protein